MNFLGAVGGFLAFFGGIGWVTIIWATASERGGWFSWALVSAFPVGCVLFSIYYSWEKRNKIN